MKLLSLNVALFESNNSKLSKFLSEQKPDIACFQEVTRAIEKSVIKKYISKDTIDNATAKLEYSLFGPVSAFRSYKVQTNKRTKYFFREQFYVRTHLGVAW